MEKIIRIIKEINPYIDVTQETKLLEEGVLDSMGIMYLIAALEDVYDIEILGENIIPENFTSLLAIENLIQISIKNK